MSKKFITIFSHGGVRRRMITLEVGRRNSRAAVFQTVGQALTAVSCWLTTERGESESAEVAKTEEEEIWIGSLGRAVEVTEGQVAAARALGLTSIAVDVDVADLLVKTVLTYQRAELRGQKS